MIVVNLTPHPIDVIIDGKVSETISPSDMPKPRLSTQDVEVGSVLGVPLVRREYGQTENLPDPQSDVCYIVSGLILSANTGRKDLLVPNTVRDKDGRIIGCDSFATN